MAVGDLKKRILALTSTQRDSLLNWLEKAAAAAAAEAAEAVFGNDLLRREIVTKKFYLEMLTRTDEDIHEAVKEWLKDPEAAERRYGHISDWDVSRVTDMSDLFCDASSFNEDLSKWQTGNVTDMSRMFWRAESFTSDLSKWQTGNVTDMRGVFYNASSFTSDLSKWQTGNVTDMAGMFEGASSFTSDLSKWQTGNVMDMGSMFCNASSFTSDLSQWDTSLSMNWSGDVMRDMFVGTKIESSRSWPHWWNPP